MDRAEVDLTALPGGKAMDSCSEPRIGAIRCRLPWSNAAAGRCFHIPFSHAASAAILAAFLTMILPALLATLRATLLARFGTHVGGLLWRTYFGGPTLARPHWRAHVAGNDYREPGRGNTGHRKVVNGRRCQRGIRWTTMAACQRMSVFAGERVARPVRHEICGLAPAASSPSRASHTQRISCVELRMPSFCMIFERCFSTVFSLISDRRPIALFVSP